MYHVICTFHYFNVHFTTQISSPTLCEVIEAEEFLQLGLLSKQEIQLFTCFLDKERMIRGEEETNQLQIGYNQQQSVPGDHLLKLFFSTDSGELCIDQKNYTVCASLVL